MGPARARRSPRSSPRLQLHAPPPEPAGSLARLSVTGWPARILVWSAEEWAGLADRPEHALMLAGGELAGGWCLLVID